ncbi:hypothetical protein Tco_0295023 [Tanacetum coccineum]
MTHFWGGVVHIGNHSQGYRELGNSNKEKNHKGIISHNNHHYQTTCQCTVKALIDQGIADALAALDADRSMNGDDSHNSGMGVRRNVRATRECTYPDFMKCQPLNFKGTKGVVELTQWTVGHDVAYAMTWTDLKKKMTDKYCPRSEIKKLEVEMWDLRMFPEESNKVENYVGSLLDYAPMGAVSDV